MARKKEAEELKPETQTELENVNPDTNKPEDIITEGTTNSEETSEPTTTSPTPPEIKDKVDIPGYVDVKLKMYPSYAELFVDNKGGVYTSKDYKSPESILYKNPYHKQ